MCAKSTDLWHTPTASGHSPSHEKRYPGGGTRKHPIPNLAAEVEQGKPYAQQVRERNAHNASQQLTFLPEGSRASLTVLPGSEEAQKMTATSGRNISGLLERQDRDTSLPRTFLESCPPISTRCYLTWKVKVTPAGRSIFQLAPSMPRIDESVSSLWPTPTAVIVNCTPEHWKTRQKRYKEGESSFNPGLKLEVAVKMWPTPRASEWKDTGPVGSKSHTHWDKRGYLGAKVKDPKQPTGQLNPTWVEWLMGFPSGWTDLEDSAMRLCRRLANG